MEMELKIEGLDKALGGLNTKIGKIKGATYAGLKEAGLFVQARAQKKVPVEYGNLRGSAYTRKSSKSTEERPSVEVGFGAAYALAVHENLEQRLKGMPRPSGLGVYWGPSGEPKFLENAFKEHTREILAIIAKRAREGMK